MALFSPEQNVDVAIEPIQTGVIGFDQLAVIVAHGGVGVDSINVRILDETGAHNVVDTLALNLGFGQFAEPAVVDSSLFNVEVSTNGTFSCWPITARDSATTTRSSTPTS